MHEKDEWRALMPLLPIAMLLKMAPAAGENTLFHCRSDIRIGDQIVVFAKILICNGFQSHCPSLDGRE